MPKVAQSSATPQEARQHLTSLHKRFPMAVSTSDDDSDDDEDELNAARESNDLRVANAMFRLEEIQQRHPDINAHANGAGPSTSGAPRGAAAGPASGESLADYAYDRLAAMATGMLRSHCLGRFCAMFPGLEPYFGTLPVMIDMLARSERFLAHPSAATLSDALLQFPWAQLLPQPLLTDLSREILDNYLPTQMANVLDADQGALTNALLAGGVFVYLHYLAQAVEAEPCDTLDRLCGALSQYVSNSLSLILRLVHTLLTPGATWKQIYANFSWGAWSLRPSQWRIPSGRSMVDLGIDTLGYFLRAQSLLNTARQFDKSPILASSGRSDDTAILDPHTIDADTDVPGADDDSEEIFYDALEHQIEDLSEIPAEDTPSDSGPSSDISDQATQKPLIDTRNKTINVIPAVPANPAKSVSGPASMHHYQPTQYRLIPQAAQSTAIGTTLGAIGAGASWPTALAVGGTILLVGGAVSALYYLRDGPLDQAAAPALDTSPDSVETAEHSPPPAEDNPTEQASACDDLTSGETGNATNSTTQTDTSELMYQDAPEQMTPSPIQVQARDTTVAKLDVVVHSLNMFSDELKAMINGANSDKTYAELIDSAHIEEFSAALNAFGIEPPEHTLMLKLEPKFVATLEALRERVRLMADDFRELSNQMYSTQPIELGLFTEYTQELNDGLESVPARLPTMPARSREMWKIITNARTINNLRAFAASETYEKVQMGLARTLRPGLTPPFDLTSPGFTAQMKAKVQTAFGMRPHEWTTNKKIVQVFNQWETEVHAIANKPSNRDQGKTVQQQVVAALGSQDGQEFGKLIKQVRETKFIEDLMKKVKQLPAELLKGTTLADLNERLAARSNRLQFGRLLASGPALGNFGNHWVNLQWTQNKVQRLATQLNIANEFFAATKVPSEFLFKILFEHFDAKKPWSESFKVVTGESLFKPPPSGPEHIEMRNLQEGKPVKAKLLKLSSAQINELSKNAKRSLYTYRGARNAMIETGKQSFFLVNDILTLATTAYNFANAQNPSETAHVVFIGKLVADSSFVAATLTPLMVGGRLPTAASRVFLFAGMATNTFIGILDVSDMVRSNAGQHVYGPAAAQLVVNTLTQGISIFHPALGLAIALLTPDFTAIGRAVQYHQAYVTYRDNHQPVKAGIAFRMYQLSVADSFPVVNWFSPVYRSIVSAETAFHPRDLAEWLWRASNEEFEGRHTLCKREIGQIEDRLHNIRFFYVTPQEFTLSYTLRNPRPFAINHFLEQHRNVTGWTAFSRSKWYLAGRPSAATLGGDTNSHVTFDDEQFGRLGESRLFTKREQPRLQLGPSATAEYFLIQSNSGDSADMPLVLDNSASLRPAIYEVISVRGSVKIINGAGNATFTLERMPTLIDGGQGKANEINFDNYKGDEPLRIAMKRFVKIQSVRGSSGTNHVTGTDGDDQYTSPSQQNRGVNDVITMAKGNDVAGVNRATVDMGEGDDMMYALSIPTSADGGPGIDVANFALLKESEYSHVEIHGTQVTATRVDGHTEETVDLKNFEAIIGPARMTTNLNVPATSGPRDFLLGTGNSNVRVARGDIRLNLGHGTNTVDTEPDIASFDKTFIIGGNGSDTLHLEMPGNSKVSIATGPGYDVVHVTARSGTHNNVVDAHLGPNEGWLHLGGDITPWIELQDEEGHNYVCDTPDRTSALILTCRGATSDQVTISKTKNEESYDANGALYPLCWIVQFGAKTFYLFGYSDPNMIIVTTGDNKSRQVKF